MSIEEYTPFTLRTDDCLPDELRKNEAILVSRPDGKFELILCCPQCGVSGGSVTGNHIYNPATQSITPSVICDVKYGGCGFHKTLMNGKWN